MQGDVFGAVLASNQIDKFGKQCLEDNYHIYMYSDIIPIAPLAMCDDILVISECGYKTDLAVAYINSQAQFNYLQFGLKNVQKCIVEKQDKNLNAHQYF